MKKLLILTLFLFISTPSFAATPVTITNMAGQPASPAAPLSTSDANLLAAVQNGFTVPMYCGPPGTNTGTPTNCNVQTPDVQVIGTVVSATTAGNNFLITSGIGQQWALVKITGLTASGAVLTPKYLQPDNVTWTAMTAYAAGSLAPLATLTADGSYWVPLASLPDARLEVTTTGTGSITFSSNASIAPITIPSKLSAPPYVGTPVGPGQFGLSVTTSTALTVPAGATWAVITAEGAAVRWRDDGTAPTATVGYPLAIGSQLTYSASLANIRFIGQAAGATLDVLYYK